MKTIILLLCLLFSINSYAQESSYMDSIVTTLVELTEADMAIWTEGDSSEPTYQYILLFNNNFRFDLSFIRPISFATIKHLDVYKGGWIVDWMVTYHRLDSLIGAVLMQQRRSAEKQNQEQETKKQNALKEVYENLLLEKK